MLTDEQIATFKERRYEKGPKIFSDKQVDVLRDEGLRVIADREKNEILQPVLCHNMSGKADAPVWQIVNIWMVPSVYRIKPTHRHASCEREPADLVSMGFDRVRLTV